ncbi:MAG TPA: amidase [Acidimicrobiales bacterium]|nr:amidase [Acidimicrobiales bacterium]
MPAADPLPDDPHDALVLGPAVLAEPTGSGPLDGLRFVAKDLFDVAGTLTGAGNPDVRADAEPAVTHAAAVARLLAAGATCVGRARTAETAYSLSAVNVHEPTPTNPAAPGRDPGGSSSGSAVAVAGGLAAVALGSDTAGSVRVPASYCGVVGVRPTHGRVPLTGVFPLAPRFDTAGWFTRRGPLAATVGSVLVDGWGSGAGVGGAGGRPTALRVAVDLFAWCEPAARESLGHAVERVAAELGVTAEPVALWGPEGGGIWAETFRTLQRHDAWAANGVWIERLRPRFGPDVAQRWAEAAATTADEADAAEETRARLAAEVAPVLDGGAVVLVPSAPGPAPELGLAPEAAAAARAQLLPFSVIAPLLGAPQASLPLAQVDGLPVGLGVLAAPGADELVCALAARLVPDRR